jgi:DNA-binding MarR family transcriptional regulator
MSAASLTSADRANDIGTVLEAVVRLSRSLSGARSTPFGELVLTRTQLEVLFVLAHSDVPVTPSLLATELKLTRGAVTQTVEQLREHALVEQSVSERDARVRIVALTPSARSQVGVYEAAAVQRSMSWFHDLRDDELARLATLLAQVRAS